MVDWTIGNSSVAKHRISTFKSDDFCFLHHKKIHMPFFYSADFDWKIDTYLQILRSTLNLCVTNLRHCCDYVRCCVRRGKKQPIHGTNETIGFLCCSSRAPHRMQNSFALHRNKLHERNRKRYLKKEEKKKTNPRRTPLAWEFHSFYIDICFVVSPRTVKADISRLQFRNNVFFFSSCFVFGFAWMEYGKFVTWTCEICLAIKIN